MKEFKKVVYSEYKDKYDENIKEQLRSSPVDIEIESMRSFLYGYTFSEKYAQGISPDELSMDYWRDKLEEIWKCENLDDIDLRMLDDIQREIEIEEAHGTIDMYDVTTVQEKRILEAIDSTGDGKSPETALCVIDVWQEYEYINRVFPYSALTLQRQSVSNGIDCLEFEPNVYGVERIYFDVTRRFEVGYPGVNEQL